MRSLLKRWFFLAAFAAAAFAPGAFAQLSIEITGGGANRLPIAIVPFAGEGAVPPGITSVVRADLERSGLFRSIESPAMTPPLTEASTVISLSGARVWLTRWCSAASLCCPTAV